MAYVTFNFQITWRFAIITTCRAWTCGVCGRNFNETEWKDQNIQYTFKISFIYFNRWRAAMCSVVIKLSPSLKLLLHLQRNIRLYNIFCILKKKNTIFEAFCLVSLRVKATQIAKNLISLLRLYTNWILYQQVCLTWLNFCFVYESDRWIIENMHLVFTMQ